MKRIFIVLGSIVALYSLFRVNTLAELQPADKQPNTTVSTLATKDLEIDPDLFVPH